MADQDFNINIRINADTSQVEAIRQSFEKLGAQVQVTNAQASAGGGGIGSLLGRLAGGLAGGIGVGTIAETLRQTTQELEKATASLAKQGELLVQNSRSMILMSKFAQDDADVLKVAESGLKTIADLHKTTEETQARELTWTEKIQDAIDKQQGFPKGFHEAQLDREREAASQAEQFGKNTAMKAVAAAEQEKERRQTQSYAEDVGELNKKIREQETLKAQHFQQNDIQGYIEASQALKEYRTQLEQVQRLHQRESQQAEKQLEGASPRVRATIGLEALQKAAADRGDLMGAQGFARSAELMKKGMGGDEGKDLSSLEKALYDQTLVLEQIRDAWK